MSLSQALDVSRSSLGVTAELTQIASRNIGRASDPGATRKIARLVTSLDGAPRIGAVVRSSTMALREGVVTASSEAARLGAISTALDRLDLTGGDTASGTSPAARVGAMKAALQVYSANPSDLTVAGAAVTGAIDLAHSLNTWARVATAVRVQADQDIRAGVDLVNQKLDRIAELNARIVAADQSGADVTDDLDSRDQVVAALAEQIGITIISRRNNAIALFTDSGLTLLDAVPRKLEIDAGLLANRGPGPAILIDGVPATGANAVMPIISGRLAGLVEVRDRTVPTIAAQLDEIANGLVFAFAERDQAQAALNPDLAGLFVIRGGGGLLPSGPRPAGGAALIEVNANVDPGRGGNVMLLRDGGIADPSNPAYRYNADNASTFTDRIEQMIDVLDQPLNFTSATGLAAPSSIFDFAPASLGWLQAQRQSNTERSVYADALLQRSQDAMQKETGINIDDEMTQLLELERTYQASAKLISTVDEMYAALMQAIR